MCSLDGPNCNSALLDCSVLLALQLKHGGDGVIVIHSIICGLVYVANVQQRGGLTTGGCHADSPA